jgi:dihydrofolate reductase
MELVLIAAVARNGVIGRGNDLVFRDPADHRHFRALTLGHPVIMGRRTWDSLPERFRPLPGRRNVVVSRQAGLVCAGAEVAVSLDDALARVADAPTAFVIGGAQLYALAIPLADRLELTEIHANFEGDAHFPAVDATRFETVCRQPQNAADGTAFDFVTYQRRPVPGH